MRSHTYSKFSPEAADAVDLQALLGKLADFLLQSGFAGGQQYDPWGDYNEEADRSLEALKQAILDALIESGQFTPELLEALRGDGDEDSEEKLAKLLDDLVQRLAAEGYLSVDAPPQVPAGLPSALLERRPDMREAEQRLIAANARVGHTVGRMIAMGDDTTDEDLFRALPEGSVTIHVGAKPSRASYRLADYRAARAFLRRLVPPG